MSAQHTPGPWMYEIDGPLTNDMRHAVLAKSTGLWVAATYRSGTQAEDDKSLDADDEAKANAKLIAAAPDMLAALIVAREFISTDRSALADCSIDHEGRMSEDDAGAVADYDKALLQIDAAIQKATGGEA